MVGLRAVVGVVLGMTTLVGCALAPVDERSKGGRQRVDDGPEQDEAVEDEAAGGTALGPNDANRLLGTNRAATFDRIRGQIESVQVISNAGLARLGLRWDDGTAFAAARARLLSARTDDDVYYALLAVQRSVHDGHSRLVIDESGPVRAPKAAVALELDVGVEYEAGSPRYVVRSGAHAGARITAVDGKPIADVERELVTWVVGNSPEHWRASVAGWLTRRVAADLPAPPTGTRTTIDLALPDGKTTPLALTWTTVAPRPAPSSDACTNLVAANPDYAARTPEHKGRLLCVYAGPNAGTKIVRWFSFDYEDEGGFRSDYEDMFGAVANAGGKKILFDVRENQGGAFDPTVVSAFTRTPVQQLAVEVVYGPGLKQNPALLDRAEGSSSHATSAKAHLLANPTAKTSPRQPFICQSEQCSAAEMTLPIPQSPMTADVAVLTGPTCFSACDNFVAMMKYAGVARIAGMPAAAGDSPVRVHLPLSLEGGAKLGIVLTVAVNRRPNGDVLEGTPDAPTVPVFPSAANRGRYLDAVLQAVGF